MGVIDWFRRGVGEMMVARPDDAKSQVVWKHPDPTIPMKSQLTVEADERAVFFKDGKVVRTMDAGRYTLDTANLPFLSDLIDSFTGGNVLIAEVFFVNIREHTGNKFGGRVGHVEDPKSGVPVETMVHGEFSFRVTDPERLILGLVGMGRAESYTVRSWMKEQVLKVIRDRIAELLVKNKWPLLDVTSGAYTEELEKAVLEGIDEHVASYGIDVVRLGNFVIDIDDEDAKNLKRLYTDAAYLRTVGGVGQYQQFAAGKAMMGAGEGMAKGGGAGGGEGGGAAGGLLGGAGLGVGFGLAQMLVRDPRGGETLAPAAAGVVCGCVWRRVVPPGALLQPLRGKELKAKEPAAAPRRVLHELRRAALSGRALLRPVWHGAQAGVSAAPLASTARSWSEARTSRRLTAALRVRPRHVDYGFSTSAASSQRLKAACATIRAHRLRRTQKTTAEREAARVRLATLHTLGRRPRCRGFSSWTSSRCRRGGVYDAKPMPARRLHPLNFVRVAAELRIAR